MGIDEREVDWQKELLLQPGMQLSLLLDIDCARRLNEKIDVASATVVSRAGAIQPDGGIIADGLANDPDDLLALSRAESHGSRGFFGCR